MSQRKKVAPPPDEPQTEQDDDFLRAQIVGLGEKSLRKSYYPKLQEKIQEVEDSNKALKQLLKVLEKEKAEVEENITLNIENNVLPILDTLLKRENSDQELLILLRKNITALTSDLQRKLVSFKYKLTPTEIKICEFIRLGYVTKEIAHLLNVAESTIKDHKNNIRKKLGVTNKNLNLKAFLDELK